MTLQLNSQEFKLLRNFIEKQSGIMLGDNKAYLIENRLSGLAKKYGCPTFGEFYLKVKNAPEERELRRLVMDAITTSETSWFRDQHPFRILRKRIFPEFLQEIRKGGHKEINIWSAACSTGQEPYSIAIAALDFYRTAGGEPVCREQVKILATDISHSSLSAATSGSYTNVPIGRGLSQEHLERYFQKEDKSWVIKDNVRSMVTFRQFNLREPLRRLGPFDIVFLRNVTIYFSEPFKRVLFDKIASIISPGGYLFLGTGETVSSYSTAFDVLEDNGAIFYRVKPKGANL